MSDSEEVSWVNWFCSLRGNEFFCAVDPQYMKDNFNLTGLPEQVPHYKEAFNLITDYENDVDLETCQDTEFSAVMLYGLIHARYILTTRGIDQMIQKYEFGDFGFCPRVYCKGQAMLPVGLTDKPGEEMVKNYCPKCVDVYSPKSSRYHNIDGAYFGTGFPHMLFMIYPEFRPEAPSEQFVPRLYGFQIHNLSSHKNLQ